MNTKILALLEKNLKEAFHLPKYEGVAVTINKETLVDELPWTPAQYRKFKDAMESELGLTSDYVGSVSAIVDDLDTRYLTRFFSEIWQPNTEIYQYTGWDLIQRINSHKPKKVLDVGCGFHPFKGKIDNIIGIDPYNPAADYQVGIMEFTGHLGTYDHILALGSINFNSREDIEQRFGKCVELLQPGGYFWLRANPGVPHKNGPYVDIFPWSFEVAASLAEKFNLALQEYKKDNNNRIYFSYKKL